MNLNYKGSIFKSYKLDSLPGGIPRIDQLVWFQENVSKMASEDKLMLEKQENLSIAYFWY